MADSETKQKDLAARITARKKLSRDWLADAFYPQCEKAYKNYKAEPDLKLDEDGKVDPELTNIGSPLTFSSSRRMVARITAQIPQFQFRSSEARSQSIAGSNGAQVPISEMIGTTQMFQWDRAGQQRIQKKHVLQAVLFGWSPRIWYWASEIFPRRKKIRIADAFQSPDLLRQIEVTYLQPGFFERLFQMIQERAYKTGQPPSPQPLADVLASLQEQYGKGGYLPIEYEYKEYEGPKAPFTFVGDCFPEPHFQSIDTSKWFICNQFRDFAWMQSMAQQYPDMRSGIEDLLRDSPRGTGKRFDTTASADDDQELFRNLLSAINRDTEFDADGTLHDHEGEWLITEHHVPGRNAYIEYMDSKSQRYLGRIDYPYDLAGKIAVTDCVLIDDLVSGIGDSIARIMRGLHQVHSEQLGYRLDAVKNLIRPIVFTRDINLVENPMLVRREHGFRLVHSRYGPDGMWQQQELAAQAAVQSSLAEDNSILQQYFLFSQENSMTATPTSDPASTRTAAGVNYMANVQDITTKDYNDAFLHSSLIADARMMYLMNRSELTDGFDFEASQYNRRMLFEREAWKENWVRAEPEHFQIDGQIGVKAGSTLAEDDLAKQQEAKELFGAAMAAPQLLSPQKARDNMLIASGHRADLPDWIPAPPPEQGPEIKLSMSASFKAEEMTPTERLVWMEKARLVEAPPGQPPQQQLPPAQQNGQPQALPMAG